MTDNELLTETIRSVRLRVEVADDPEGFLASLISALLSIQIPVPSNN